MVDQYLPSALGCLLWDQNQLGLILVQRAIAEVLYMHIAKSVVREDCLYCVQVVL